jgi:pimeloyl-ACP methyl ester carboxylesterase
VNAISVYPDTELDLIEVGEGRPVLLLHGGGGPGSCHALADALGDHARVLLPTHPGFAGTPRPEWMDTVDDLAYLYLDLLEERDLSDVLVVGCSLGGWIAAEMAVRDQSRIAGLILVGAVGIRVGGREDRDITDLFALGPDEVRALTYHDLSKAPPVPMEMSPEQATELAYNQEALVLYGWEPYLHNPKLRRRLGRLRVPTLVVWGESDGIVAPDYGRAYAESIPGARFELVAEAGHAPHVEQTQLVSELVLGFAERNGQGRRR